MSHVIEALKRCIVILTVIRDHQNEIDDSIRDELMQGVESTRDYAKQALAESDDDES